MARWGYRWGACRTKHVTRRWLRGRFRPGHRRRRARSNKEHVQRAFIDDMRVALVGELRDHVGHHGLPPLNLRTSWTKDNGMSFTPILQLGPIPRDKRIRAEVRTYLTGLGDEIDFEPVFEEYATAQWSWFRWFQNELRTRFAAQLDELDAELASWINGASS
jgi:hypothetical protein